MALAVTSTTAAWPHESDGLVFASDGLADASIPTEGYVDDGEAH